MVSKLPSKLQHGIEGHNSRKYSTQSTPKWGNQNGYHDAGFQSSKKANKAAQQSFSKQSQIAERASSLETEPSVVRKKREIAIRDSRTANLV